MPCAKHSTGAQNRSIGIQTVSIRAVTWHNMCPVATVITQEGSTRICGWGGVGGDFFYEYGVDGGRERVTELGELQ